MSSAGEFVVAAILFGLLLAFKVMHITRSKFDTDEPQHLHVVWAWARGLVQYRDVFDNHMPLFHIMFAPIYGIIGDRPTILYWMRLLMVPVYVATAWCTYGIGRLLFSRRAGIWAVILAGFYGAAYFLSIEFRPDNLWACSGLLCIVVLLDGPLTVHRALVAGLLLGFCFGLSLKSGVLLISMGTAVLVALFIFGADRLEQSPSYMMRFAILFGVGTSLVPAVIVLAFWLKGVWPTFRYNLFDFNLLTARFYEERLFYHHWLAWTVAAGFCLIAAFILRRRFRPAGVSALGVRRTFVFLLAVIYLGTLKSHLWPLSLRQDYAPIYALAAVLISGALIALSQRLSSSAFRIGKFFEIVPMPAAVALIEIALLAAAPTFWKNRTNQQTAMLRDVLALTEPGDYVLDAKGETIFRQRCIQPILEIITTKAIRLGVLSDNAAERCVATRTCVVSAAALPRLSLRSRKFIERAYLPVTRSLLVPGVIPRSSVPGRYDFEIEVPATYTLVTGHGRISGRLDGTDYEGARFLGAGVHTFETAWAGNDLFAVWSRAADRHFTPELAWRIDNRSSPP